MTRFCCPADHQPFIITATLGFCSCSGLPLLPTPHCFPPHSSRTPLCLTAPLLTLPSGLSLLSLALFTAPSPPLLLTPLLLCSLLPNSLLCYLHSTLLDPGYKAKEATITPVAPVDCLEAGCGVKDSGYMYTTPLYCTILGIELTAPHVYGIEDLVLTEALSV